MAHIFVILSFFFGFIYYLLMPIPYFFWIVQKMRERVDILVLETEIAVCVLAAIQVHNGVEGSQHIMFVKN